MMRLVKVCVIMRNVGSIFVLEVIFFYDSFKGRLEEEKEKKRV